MDVQDLKGIALPPPAKLPATERLFGEPVIFNPFTLKGLNASANSYDKQKNYEYSVMKIVLHISLIIFSIQTSHWFLDKKKIFTNLSNLSGFLNTNRFKAVWWLNCQCAINWPFGNISVQPTSIRISLLRAKRIPEGLDQRLSPLYDWDIYAPRNSRHHGPCSQRCWCNCRGY